MLRGILSYFKSHTNSNKQCWLKNDSEKAGLDKKKAVKLTNFMGIFNAQGLETYVDELSGKISMPCSCKFSQSFGAVIFAPSRISKNICSRERKVQIRSCAYSKNGES